MPDRAATMRVAGQEFKVSTLERVFYPVTGTTKADVIDYYLQVAAVMLAHLAGRPATRKRWPDGVDGPEFFAKDLEVGTPAWLTRVQIRHSSGPKFYPVMDTPASLGWLGQVAALELHVPQWRIETDLPGVTATSTVRHPDRVVFDLDPGPGVGLAECVEVALYLRKRLGPLGDRVVPVTSGNLRDGVSVWLLSLTSKSAACRSLGGDRGRSNRLSAVTDHRRAGSTAIVRRGTRGMRLNRSITT